jgi:hypothetical protein
MEKPEKKEPTLARDYGFAVEHTAVCLATDALWEMGFAKFFLKALPYLFGKKEAPGQEKGQENGQATSERSAPKSDPFSAETRPDDLLGRAKVVAEAANPLRNIREIDPQWGAEIIADVTAAAVYPLTRRLTHGIVSPVKNLLKQGLDFILDPLGRKNVAHWAEHHQVAPDSALYREKLEHWKDETLDTALNSATISLTSLALNVGLQKSLFKVKEKVGTIIASKLLAAITTTGVMTALRGFILPRTMHSFEKEIEHYAAPLANIGKHAHETAENGASVVEEEHIWRKRDYSSQEAALSH